MSNQNDELTLTASGLRMPTFDGKKSAYKLWVRKNAAYMAVKNVAEALDESIMQANLPADHTTVLDLTDTTQKKQAEYKMKNAVAMALFTSMFQTEELMNTIDNAATAEWPGIWLIK